MQTFAVHTSAAGSIAPSTILETNDPMDSYDVDIFSKMAMDQPAMSSVASNHHETMIVLEYCDKGSMQEVLYLVNHCLVAIHAWVLIHRFSNRKLCSIQCETTLISKITLL